MKKFIPIDEMVQNLTPKRFVTWFDRLSFFRIFVLWAFAVVLFGVVYYLFATGTSYLYYGPSKTRASAVVDNIYFSFVTATTTGFGDVIPIGNFKWIAIFEVVFGLLLLAFVTSKLVSIKQDIILGELYERSFSESIYNLRSSLMVFRQNLTRIITRVEDNSIKRRELTDLYLYFSSFEDSLHQITGIVTPTEKNRFKKVVDPLNAEILFNSVLQSLEKVIEFIHEMNKNRIDWKRDLSLDLIEKCILLSDELFSKAKSSKVLNDKLLNDLTLQKKDLQDKIRQGLSLPEKEPASKGL